MNARALALALSLPAVALLPGATCTGPSPCQCSVCSNAIELAVFRADNEALDNSFIVEATLDGLPVEDISNCDPEVRFDNACFFGTASGLYRMTVSGPGFVPRVIAARAAAKSGEDCCNTCLEPTTVSAFLERDLAVGEP